MTLMGAVLGAYLSANGVWYDQSAFPSDVEGGMNLKASLSPHVSLVGSGVYGFRNTYIAGAGGVRFTITDPDNPDVSVGLGAQYNVSNDHDIRPEETSLDASVGLRPWPGEQPRVTVGVQGRYGLQSHKGAAILALRYAL